ncbi:MAG: DUF3857 domain-containing protein [Phycisphaerae bacterium]
MKRHAGLLVLVVCAFTSHALLAQESSLSPLSTQDVRARIDAVDAKNYDADVVVVLERTAVNVRPSGIGENTTQRVVKILRDGGIRSQSVQRFGYDPTTNRFAVKALRVYRAGGDVQEIVADNLADHPDPQGSIYWGSRQTLVSIPRLEIGDAVETIVEKVGFNVAYLGQQAQGGSAGGATAAGGDPAACELVPPMVGHWYDSVEFWSGVPVIEKRYSVRTPRDMRLQFAVYNGELRSATTFDGDAVVYSFEKREIPVFQGEPNMVSAEDVACKLVLATLDTWEAKSRWFHAANEAAFKVDDAIKAKTQEIIAGLKTDEERITALNHWVAENIRYVGTSRGPCEGYTTHAAIETFHDRGGVCKDKAGLLVAMLRLAGFESYIVMTMAGAEVWPVPADQFNHAVTCIREKDGAFRLLDPTWMPRSRDNWSTFASLQHVVYGTPEGQPLMRSPACPPETNRVAWKVESEISTTGDLTSALNLVISGGPETNLRKALWARHPAERDRFFEESAKRMSPVARVVSATAGSPIDFGGPLQSAIKVEADDYVLGNGERRFLTLPSLRSIFHDSTIGDVLGAAGPESRKHKMKIRTTRSVRFEETLRLPKAWSVVRLPEAIKLDGPAAGLVFEATHSEGVITIACELTIKKHKIEPAEYANFKQVVEAFNKLCGEFVECRAEPVTAHGG